MCQQERDHAIVRNLMPDLDQAGPQGPAPLHRAQSPPAPLGNPHEVAMWQAEAQQPGGSAWCQEFGKLAWWVRFALLCTVGARVRHPDLTQVSGTPLPRHPGSHGRGFAESPPAFFGGCLP